MKQVDRILAEKLLKISAIKLQPENPFTWSSGWNSPIYTDNRKTLSYPEVRNFIKVELSRLVMENFPDTEVVAGVATGAIAQGALVSDTLGVPYIYVRSTPKDHGLENLIEGNLKPGQKVVVVEDLVSTGGSSLKAVEAIRNAGAKSAICSGMPFRRNAYRIFFFPQQSNRYLSLTKALAYRSSSINFFSSSQSAMRAASGAATPQQNIFCKTSLRDRSERAQ